MTYHPFPKKSFPAILIPAVMWLMSAGYTEAQIPYSEKAGIYRESFDEHLPGAPLDLLWENQETFNGWSVYTEKQGVPATYRRTSTYSTPERFLHHFRTNGQDANGSLGAVPFETTGDIAMVVSLRNETGETLTEFFLAYVGEQWRKTNSGVRPQIRVFYKLGDPGDLFGGDWTEIPGMEFVTPHADTVGGVENIRGKDAENQARLEGSVKDIIWKNGEVLSLQWRYEYHTPGGECGFGNR